MPLISILFRHLSSIANIVPILKIKKIQQGFENHVEQYFANDHEHISRLICTGGSCTGNSIIHSLTRGHKGINTVLFELDNNLLERSLL